MTDKRLTNNLRVELYKLLFPKIIEEDHKGGVESYINFWDDPLIKWDDGALWDELGVVPVIKNMFFAIEQEESRDLEFVDKLTDLIDADKCPEDFLDVMARSLGYPLEEGLEEAEKREVVKSIVHLHKSRGREVSWEVFYRMMGWEIQAIPLWKKKIFEDNDDYHTERYRTEEVENEQIGVAGSQYYDGFLTQAPVKPGSVRIKVDGKVFRDDGNRFGTNYGTLIAGDDSTGTVNYATGEYHIELENVSSTDVFVDYHRVTEEFPYKAARVDLEFYIFLDDSKDTHTFTQATINRLLERVEEVRPIHVLLRLIILVLDAPEEVNDFATDGIVCGPRMGKDVRQAEYRFYAADSGLDSKDSTFEINKLNLSGADDKIRILSERVGICPTADKLTIEFDNGSPTQYW